MNGILIPIISEFQGKGFKDASKATSGLERGLKRLALTLGAALSIRKITQFSKASVRAFSEEDRAVRALATNLQNLGLAYDVRPIEDYITKLQYATGVADGELRPAFQQLATATGNLAKAQDLLGLSLDIAAGTGKSVGQVTQALSRAYLGTTTSLARLNIGLSKADLTTKSFNEISEELTKRFSGQAARAASTYAGQLDILSAAADDAQETIGKGLVNAIQLLGAEQGITKSVNAMQDLARFASDATLATALAISKIQQNDSTWLDIPKKLWLFAWQPFLDDVKKGAAEARQQLLGLSPTQTLSPRVMEMEAAAAVKRWKKEQREIEKNRKEQERIAKAAKMAREETERRRKILEKLNQAGSILDTEKASIEAALQNKSLSENEVLRLQLKKALINENADRAATLADKLAKSQDELKQLQDFQLTNNPFDNWMKSLEQFRVGLGQVTVPLSSIFSNQTLDNISKNPPNIFTDPGFSFDTGDYLPNSFGGGILPMPSQQGAQINITVQGTGGLDAETKQAVVDAVVEASSSGYSTQWFRTTSRAVI